MHDVDKGQPVVESARERLLSGLPVTEKRLELAGLSTSVLKGGEGPPVVLLHGPGEYALKWRRVIPELVKEHHVVAADLPGHGASESDGALDADRVLAWLGELVDETCPSPPALVGQILGGAIAARFAAEGSSALSHLVLVDALGLAPFQPAPEFGKALTDFLGNPSDATHERLWQRCAFALDRLRDGMGESWEWLESYNIERARVPGVQAALRALMEQFGFPAIAPEVLARIAVPTTLVWGRHDLATPLAVAEAASARYGWTLQVIEDAADDPPLEQPEAFFDALRLALRER